MYFYKGAKKILRIILTLTLTLLGGCTISPRETTSETPDPSPYRSAMSEERESRIVIGFAGDVMLGRLVNQVIQEKGRRYIWGDVLSLLHEPDLALANLECVIAESGEPFYPPRVFYFRALPQAMETLSIAGIDYVSLANNHAMDFRGPALLETIQHLDKHGIAHAGAGKNLSEASKPAVVEARGIKIGVVAFADHYREYGAGTNSPGTNIIRISLKKDNFRRVSDAIQSARDAGADLVVFSIHWGPNMRQAPTRDFINFAHAVMDAGADIYHGHSAHIFQGVEIYKGKPILYDTGELIDDYYVDPVLRNDQQLLFFITVTPRKIERVELIPLLINHMQVNRARGEEFNTIKERLIRLSRVFGTEIIQEGDRLVIDVDQGQ
jgi:poly-gamma-glutamate capsule biosynthesis protein CapA/YwtB (metallophosphatase superfamily)